MYTLSRMLPTHDTYTVIQNFCTDAGLASTPSRDDMGIFVSLFEGVKEKKPAINNVSFIMTDLELDVIDSVNEDSKLLVCYGKCPPLAEKLAKNDETNKSQEGYIDTEFDFSELMIIIDFDFDASTTDIDKLQPMLKEYCSDSLVFGGNIVSVYENEEDVMLSLDGVPK